MNRPNEGHHIVVIGDGADSFVLAARLAHKLGRDGKALVTLVDQSMSTRWTPFLYEVEGVVFNESAANAARAMPKTLHPFQLRLGRIDAIDRVKKEITLALVADEEGRELIPARRLDYDTLILELIAKSVRSCALNAAHMLTVMGSEFFNSIQSF